MAISEPVLRAPRAAFFAAACTLISAVGHTLTNHAPVSLGAGLAGAVGVFALGYVLGRRERGLSVLLPATSIAQLLLHELFGGNAPTAMTLGHASHVTSMPLIHAAIAVVTAWWLHRGESALWLMIRMYARPFGPAPWLLGGLPRRPEVVSGPAEAPRRSFAGRMAGPAPVVRGPPAYARTP
ncbi:hypothetical protein J5X84_26390 [Streptosporangiaceae bacterium NEAU-GS5]|nr:hypothetical protein [Streptosporangiaceae bacterium NEAU-GS5]